jgi:hypothetical protein
MIQVIDSVQFDEQALRSDPAFLENAGPGLLVRVDVGQRPSFLITPGSTVRVHRPDGTCIDRVVSAVEMWGPHVGLFFSKTEQHEIPISSEIELPA